MVMEKYTIKNELFKKIIQTVVYFMTFYDVLLVELIDYMDTFISLVLHGKNHIYLYSPDSSSPIK